MYCRLKLEMVTGQGAPCQNSRMSEHKYGRAGVLQRCPEVAKERGRNGDGAMSKVSGALVMRNRMKGWQRMQEKVLLVCHRDPKGNSMAVGSQTVLS